MARNGITDLWPWKLIWRTRLPLKVICFSWTALYEACLTQENLVKKNFQLVNRCYMCQRDAETNNQLFLHCRVAADIWSMFCSVFGISRVMPYNMKEAFQSWASCKVDKTIKNIWRMIPASSMLLLLVIFCIFLMT
ncbi:uncharacterized protein [Nicotiana sylvestris]|uniref:uncharacterized protein n=1 Tax=Nicotiana sylvestris TaxID=4096 RepID=UPI00388C346E